jgi:flavodoxin
MHAVVLYDSQFGNTERIARAVAAALAGDGPVQVRAVDDTRALPPAVDLLVIGGPTHAHGLSQPMKAFLAVLPKDTLRGLPAATFDTRYDKPRWLTGSAAVTLARRLSAAGARLVVAPESFFVSASEGPLGDGELERAAGWARMLAAVMGRVAEPVAAG